VIIIISNKKDITSDFIVNELNIRNKAYYRLNTEDIGVCVDIIIDFDNQRYLLIDRKRDVEVNLETVRSVYYRRPELPDYENFDLTDGERQFLQMEIFYLLEGLYRILNDKFWISSVFSIREAENKIYQFMLAKKIGFNLPSSMITNVSKEAIDFICKNNKECVIKPVKTGLIQDHVASEIIFTSRLKAKHIEMIDRIKNVPTCFQKEIIKKADIRVTIVGHQIFAAEILSQICEETKTDWRKGSHTDLEYRKIHLPETIKNKCIQLLDILKLNYGAIDFVLDKNGEYIFLEINPNGQWGWIQKKVGFKICEAIVDMLLNAEDNADENNN
jgi:glutathione synthase/RimK-type ligase-like ATP-grasp enzyme